MPERAEYAVGCLLIGGRLSGEGALSGLSSYLNGRGMLAEVFEWRWERNLHLALQRAYQRVRRRSACPCIAAIGAGCDAALAIAGQLPVDRMILLTGGAAPARDEVARAMRGVRAYARRSLAFCVADVMVVQWADAARRLSLEGLAGALVNCRVCGARVDGAWINRKDQMNEALYGFLSDGVLPKSLAENAEMCIIYG